MDYCIWNNKVYVLKGGSLQEGGRGKERQKISVGGGGPKQKHCGVVDWNMVCLH